MLVQFTFNNFKCFKDETTISFVAPSYEPAYYTCQSKHKYSVLKTLAFYGANGSGKSVLFEALAFMRHMACFPGQEDKNPFYRYWYNQYDSFRLNTYSDSQDSCFEVVFLLDDIQYRYGFTLDRNRIIQEWLYRNNHRETKVFVREGWSIEVNGNYVDKETFNTLESEGLIKEYIPLLPILAKFNDTLSKSIVDWFESITIVTPFITNMKELIEPGHKEGRLSFMKALDFNILDLQKPKVENVSEVDSRFEFEETNEELLPYDDEIKTVHIQYNELYNRADYTNFSWGAESVGARVLLGMAVKVTNSLRNGNLVLIDGFDSNIHPNILKTIISLFYKVDTHAQLVFSAHNTSLLSAKDDHGRNLLTPDQVYMVNKNRYGESSVTRLSEFKGVNVDNMEDLYLEGALSGVPNIDEEALMNLIQNIQND